LLGGDVLLIGPGHGVRETVLAPQVDGRREQSAAVAAAAPARLDQQVGDGGCSIASRQVPARTASSSLARTCAGNIRRYAVRQVESWMRAISAASSGRAGRTKPRAMRGAYFLSYPS